MNRRSGLGRGVGRNGQCNLQSLNNYPTLVDTSTFYGLSPHMNHDQTFPKSGFSVQNPSFSVPNRAFSSLFSLRLFLTLAFCRSRCPGGDTLHPPHSLDTILDTSSWFLGFQLKINFIFLKILLWDTSDHDYKVSGSSSRVRCAIAYDLCWDPDFLST